MLRNTYKGAFSTAGLRRSTKSMALLGLSFEFAEAISARGSRIKAPLAMRDVFRACLFSSITLVTGVRLKHLRL